MSNSQVSSDLDFFEGEYTVAKAAYDKAKKATDQAKVRRYGKRCATCTEDTIGTPYKSHGKHWLDEFGFIEAIDREVMLALLW